MDISNEEIKKFDGINVIGFQEIDEIITCINLDINANADYGSMIVMDVGLNVISTDSIENGLIKTSSGSPAFKDNKLIGITSSNIQIAGARHSYRFISVIPYLDIIT
ncbi:MAG: hypothetical protein ABFS16_13045 [Bacteroidota bacterium]